jgi:hypothetical protein
MRSKHSWLASECRPDDRLTSGICTSATTETTYEWRDDSGDRCCSYGEENWKLNSKSLVRLTRSPRLGVTFGDLSYREEFATAGDESHGNAVVAQRQSTQPCATSDLPKQSPPISKRNRKAI